MAFFEEGHRFPTRPATELQDGRSPAKRPTQEGDRTFPQLEIDAVATDLGIVGPRRPIELRPHSISIGQGGGSRRLEPHLHDPDGYSNHAGTLVRAYAERNSRVTARISSGSTNQRADPSTSPSGS